jgi:hypothetical protein
MAIDTGTLNSLYKVAYAKGVEDLLPKASKLSDMIDFVPSELQNGKQYEQPVVLAAEQGFTYSLDTQNAYDLNDSIGMAMQSAIVPGCDIVLDSTVGYNQAARASHSATSFKSVMSTKFENMLKSSEKRLEIAMLYGNDHIAQAATQAVVIASSMLPIVIDTDEWATGIWTGMENANVVFVKASDNTAVDSLRSFKVAQVDVDNRTVYFAAGTAGTAGTLTTLETAIEAYAVNIHFYGSCSGSAGTFAYAEMSGLKKIITNTGSLFGIDAATYDLWKGNSVTTSGQLTMAKVLSMTSKAVQRGLDEDVVLLVNPSTWADLASNLAALRRFDGSYSKGKNANGSKEIEYFGQNGAIKIVSYNIVKEGDCFIFPVSKTIRIGARELSLNDPTRPSDEIFFTIPGKAGVGLRAYTNQAIFLEAPAQAVFATGIVNSNAA